MLESQKSKSKFDLNKLQEEFDKILDSFDKNSLLNWLGQDREEQLKLLLAGKPITLISFKGSNIPTNKTTPVNEINYSDLSLAA